MPYFDSYKRVISYSDGPDFIKTKLLPDVVLSTLLLDKGISVSAGGGEDLPREAD